MTVITLPDCELCNDMVAVAKRVAPAHGAVVQVVDLSQAPQPRPSFSDLPLLLIDGRRAFKYRVSDSELRRCLRRHRVRRGLQKLASALRAE